MKNRINYSLVLKLTTERLKRANWNLNITLNEARANNEVVSLSESQVLRWIDKLNNICAAPENIAALRRQIRAIQKLEVSVKHRNEIRRLYSEIDRLQFKPDYLLLVVETVADYKRACKGFTVNDIEYVRLVGTNGGVKTKTIVFVSKRLVGELRKRIDNGRDTNTMHVPAKLEAYRALACSATTPVSLPRGILVVPDCETKFVEDIIEICDGDDDNEPVLEYIDGATVKLNESDGYGLMCPALAQRWSQELGLSYISCGLNTRFAFEKGMVFAFDFHKFAREIARKSTVTDIWGNEVDINNIELVLTASMLKLWNSYESCEHYLRCCTANQYEFGIAKTCPEALESWRNTNYQFLQSYDLSDDDIHELVQPTLDRIKDVISGDWRKAALFLGAQQMKSISYNSNNAIATALLIEPRMHNDPMIRKKLKELIQGEIDDAKIGVLGTHGNYSVVSGDPYSLCQSMFKLKVTGLLRAGEIYNQYWADRSTKKAVVFRAPMTCHNNIRVVDVADKLNVRNWYKYMTACTVLNSWDSIAHALNGMDKDGDMVFITDNPVLLRNTKPTRAILCTQRSAKKKLPKETDLIRSNIKGFGDDIGKITNYITSMFDVQSRFAPGSKEYETLSYRIICGQHFQQLAIDKAKGIVSRPMPKHWYSYGAAKAKGDFDLSIVASRKPYFMRYIYPPLAKKLREYENSAIAKYIREFRENPGNLFFAVANGGSSEKEQFCQTYQTYYPASNFNCITNKICRLVEKELIRIAEPTSIETFNLSMLRGSASYSKTHYKAIMNFYHEYMTYLKALKIDAKHKRASAKTTYAKKIISVPHFSALVYGVCSNRDTVLDILIDLCYQSNKSKQFVWDMAFDAICQRLLKFANYRVAKFSVCNEDNFDVMWCGVPYQINYEEVSTIENDCSK